LESIRLDKVVNYGYYNIYDASVSRLKAQIKKGEFEEPAILITQEKPQGQTQVILL
jgi:hypothetical protein